jgi:hypothetical protein
MVPLILGPLTTLRVGRYRCKRRIDKVDGIEWRIDGRQILGVYFCGLRMKQPRNEDQPNAGKPQESIDERDQLHEPSLD